MTEPVTSTELIEMRVPRGMDVIARFVDGRSEWQQGEPNSECVMALTREEIELTLFYKKHLVERVLGRSLRDGDG